MQSRYLCFEISAEEMGGGVNSTLGVVRARGVLLLLEEGAGFFENEGALQERKEITR